MEAAPVLVFVPSSEELARLATLKSVGEVPKFVPFANVLPKYSHNIITDKNKIFYYKCHLQFTEKIAKKVHLCELSSSQLGQMH